MSVFGDEYSNFIKYTSKKTMTMGVCYSDLSKKKNMFEFYQQDKKWHFLSNIAYKQFNNKYKKINNKYDKNTNKNTNKNII